MYCILVERPDWYSRDVWRCSWITEKQFILPALQNAPDKSRREASPNVIRELDMLGTLNHIKVCWNHPRTSMSAAQNRSWKKNICWCIRDMLAAVEHKTPGWTASHWFDVMGRADDVMKSICQSFAQWLTASRKRSIIWRAPLPISRPITIMKSQDTLLNGPDVYKSK